MELTNLNGKVAQLSRTNQLLDGEVSTLKVQLDSRNKALQVGEIMILLHLFCNISSDLTLSSNLQFFQQLQI